MIKILLSVAFACLLAERLEAKLRTSVEVTEQTKACSCLNGGTCTRYNLYRRQRCICPQGYVGQMCETDIKSKCYNDMGFDYRGTASTTSHGRQCIRWDAIELRNYYFNAHKPNALEHGLGQHNYCRNPSKGMKPWCYFKNGKKIATMQCDIPRCEKEESTEPTCGQRQQKMYKIVRGQSTPIESQPWIAAMYQISRRHKQEFFLCGATLINPCWAVTASHCFPDGEFVEPKDYVIVLGKSNLDETNEDKEQKFLVEKIILHEKYSDQTGALDNDIALIRIRTVSGQCASLTESVQPICLPPADLKLADNTKCEIAGYGKESYNSIVYSKVLKSGSIQLISPDLCQSAKYYGKLMNNKNMFCAGDPEWKVDACKGDSGGPLICERNGQMMLYGIISWGDECGKEHKPGVYTRVTQYLPWIQENIAEDEKWRSRKNPF
uniref:Urokinase-type plasminogen activator n=1 Tax=Leptobrachium leishanense TaxID=445787 RepID=A0A8C5Q516_9ANUR